MLEVKDGKEIIAGLLKNLGKENSEKIIAILEDFKKSIKELEEIVERMIQETNYEYINYERRLLYGGGDKEYEESKEEVMGEMQEIFNKYGLCEGNKIGKILIEKIVKEYLEELILIKMDLGLTPELEGYELTLEKTKKKGWELELENKTVGIRFNLLDLDKERLEVIFKNLKNVRNIDLGFNKLWNLDKERLGAIFSNLKKVRSINLGGNDLGELDKERLEIIFNNLKNVRSINLSSNKLGDLDKESLGIIFSNLQNVRNIDLSLNDLWDLDKESLEVIFRNLKNVRSINLGSNDLGKLDKKSLEVIFSNLQNVNNINLGYNSLGGLDKESLEILLSKLKNFKRIKLSGNKFSKEQKQLIKEILGEKVKIKWD